MKLKYETAIATLVQFITLTLLGIPNALVSIVTTCHRDGSNCVSNTITSLLFFLLTAVWFGALWVLGYSAQERRSRLLAWLLIGAELVVIMVAFGINFRHDSNFLSLGTSILDILLALWTILLAFRLSRSKGGRIVKSTRNRQRHSTKEPPTLL